MSERGPSFNPEAEKKPKLEITERPEYDLACAKTRTGGDLIKALKDLGVPETELKPFAIDRLEQNIRKGYGLEAVRSIARQANIITEAEVDELFAEVTAKILTEKPTETEEEKKAREDRELEEMLSQYQ
ncbi:MAG TPA: hypothetical protein VLK22_04705 [Candidatus Udaeobacter sp.]|nr:hypothetical protein [Candidatus Udaeobacter sp.]